MAFKDKYGVTELTTSKDHEELAISLDSDSFEDDEVDPKLITFATMLYVPNKGKFEHYHIDLTDASCIELYEWLGEYLKYKNLTGGIK